MSTEIKLSKPTIPDDKIILSLSGIFEFKIGMKVQVDYVNPTGGWTVIWLMDDKENIVLTCSARIEEKALVLNTKIDGTWGSEVRPGGYDFTPGITQYVSIESEQDHFVIRINNNDLVHYTYRLPPTSIHSVVVLYKKSGTAAPTQLKSVAYKY